MNHPTPAEIHDHVYGFRPSGHVAACPECRAAAESVEAERRAIADALREEMPEAPPDLLARASARPRRARITFLGIAAAVALLAGLGWLLTWTPHDPGRTAPGDAGRRTAGDGIDRLILELRSASMVRRDLAAHALRAHGELALDKLRKARVDPALFPDTRFVPEDRELRKKLDTQKMDLSFENETLDEVLQLMGRGLGAKIVIDPDLKPRVDLRRTITFKTKDLLAVNCLKLLLYQVGADFRCEAGEVVLIDPAHKPAPARAPVRLGENRPAAARWLRVLAEGPDPERDRALEELRFLGFAAEPALWDALDSPVPAVRGGAGQVLRWLYEPAESGKPLAPGGGAALTKSLFGTALTIDMENAPLTALVDYLREVSRLNLHISGVDNPDQLAVTIKAEDLTLYGALVLSFDAHQLTHVLKDDVILVTSKAPEASSSRLKAPWWEAPDQAAKIERLVEDVARGDVAARDRAAGELLQLGEQATGLLWKASKVLEGEAGDRCRLLRDRMIRELDLGAVAEPRVDALRTPAQEAVLAREFDLAAVGQTLAEILTKLGVRHNLRGKADRKFTVSVKGVRLGAVLRAFTRPYGLDFLLEGETVVVDAAVRIRAASEK